MFLAEMWKRWKRRPRAFTDRQLQRRKTAQRPLLILEALEDRALLTTAAAQLTQVSLTPSFVSLSVTETLTCHVSSSTPVHQGTVTFTLSHLSASANVDANGNAIASLNLPMLGLEMELGGVLTSDNVTASLALPMLELLVPQVIDISYQDPTNNLMASTDPEAALWSPINAVLPSTAAFTPSGQIVTANLYGVGVFSCIYDVEGLLREIDITLFHFAYRYIPSDELIQLLHVVPSS
jgi:hypothetical protein